MIIEVCLALMISMCLLISIIKNNANLILVSYLLFIFFYDWLYLQIGLNYSNSFIKILQFTQEFFVLYLIGLLLVNCLKEQTIVLYKYDLFFLLFIFFPSSFAVCISLINGDSLDAVIKGLRLYFIPVLIPYLLFKCQILHRININIFTYVIFFLAFISCINGVIQVYFGDGSLKNFWFYETFYEYGKINLLERSYYNYIRNSCLRATAFFTSSIHLVVFLYMCSLLVILRYKLRLFSILFFTILVFGIELSATRVGYIAIILGICTYFIGSYYRKKFLFVIIPLTLIVTTFYFLIYGSSIDMSSAGRLVQYGSFFTNFSFIGNGIGNRLSLTYYDSFYLSLFNAFGVIGLFYLYYFFLLIFSFDFNNKTTVVLSVISSVFIYLFAFQFIAGSFSFKLLFIILYLNYVCKYPYCSLQSKN